MDSCSQIVLLWLICDSSTLFLTSTFFSHILDSLLLLLLLLLPPDQTITCSDCLIRSNISAHCTTTALLLALLLSAVHCQLRVVASTMHCYQHYTTSISRPFHADQGIIFRLCLCEPSRPHLEEQILFVHVCQSERA